MVSIRQALVSSLVLTVVVLGSPEVGQTASAWCRYRGETDCSVLGSGSGGLIPSSDKTLKARGSGR
jgi:hypothetical protein